VNVRTLAVHVPPHGVQARARACCCLCQPMTACSQTTNQSLQPAAAAPNSQLLPSPQWQRWPQKRRRQNVKGERSCRARVTGLAAVTGASKSLGSQQRVLLRLVRCLSLFARSGSQLNGNSSHSDVLSICRQRPALGLLFAGTLGSCTAPPC